MLKYIAIVLICNINNLCVINIKVFVFVDLFKQL